MLIRPKDLKHVPDNQNSGKGNACGGKLEFAAAGYNFQLYDINNMKAISRQLFV